MSSLQLTDLSTLLVQNHHHSPPEIVVWVDRDIDASSCVVHFRWQAHLGCAQWRWRARGGGGGVESIDVIIEVRPADVPRGKHDGPDKHHHHRQDDEEDRTPSPPACSNSRRRPGCGHLHHVWRNHNNILSHCTTHTYIQTNLYSAKIDVG